MPQANPCFGSICG